jgi:hypothetical protein
MKRSEVIIGIEMYLRALHYMDLEELCEEYECRFILRECGHDCMIEFEYPRMGQKHVYSETVGSVMDVYDFMGMVKIKLNLNLNLRGC